MAETRKILGISTLHEMRIVNPQGEKLGKLERIMFDVETGSVVYAVLSFKEFLDFKDKLFALPWRLFHVDQEQKHLVVNISRERLKVMPGFDKDDWPKMENPRWQALIADFYHDY